MMKEKTFNKANRARLEQAFDTISNPVTPTQSLIEISGFFVFNRRWWCYHQQAPIGSTNLPTNQNKKPSLAIITYTI
ncbi:MAG: hypothetical protein EOP47_05135 [Sphingobacteriaceae bacterium]|nr:MAG: hypothetical protein EOP47_05135 [Sphingobacteriaceae bacterium]